MVLEEHTVRSWTQYTVSLNVELRHFGRMFTLYLPGDVQMSRVKMNARHEYEYIGNFKVLQNIFKAKKIDKVRILHVAM